MKDECAIALKGKENIPKVFAQKDELAMASIYLALDEVVL